METLRKAFRELSAQYLHTKTTEQEKRILRKAIKGVMVDMKQYLPAPVQYVDPLTLDP